MLPANGQFPYELLKEVTVIWGDWAVTFFVINLDEEANNADDADTKLNHIRICNHLPQPLSISQGATKRGEPPADARGAARLPFIGSTGMTIP